MNCGAPITDRFCSQCGQDHRLRRLNLREILLETAKALWSLELPAIRTIIQLSWRPGWVAAEYVAGRRQAFSSPLGFCLLMTALSVLSLQFWGPDLIGMIQEPGTTETDPELLVWMEGVVLIMDASIRYAALITILLLPLAATFSRLFFLRSGRNFAEHCVLGLYLHGQWYLISLLLLPLAVKGIVWAALMTQLSIILLYGLGAVHFFPGRRWVNALLGLVVGVCYLAALLVIYLVATLVVVIARNPDAFGPA